jgi:hypothetical protein
MTPKNKRVQVLKDNLIFKAYITENISVIYAFLCFNHISEVKSPTS